MTIRAKFRWVFKKTQVERRMYRKQRRVLFRTGRYGMKVMRSLFKSRKGTSRKDSPPFTHGKKTLRRNTFFKVDGNNRVIVGPALLPGQSTRTTRTRKPIPQVLNEGGTIRKKTRRGYKRRRIGRRPFTERTRTKTIPTWRAIMESEQL